MAVIVKVVYNRLKPFYKTVLIIIVMVILIKKYW